MSDVPVPKYAIGETIYLPEIESTTEKLPCPDCLGERKWKMTTPTGIEHTMSCPRCSDAYSSLNDRIPSLTIQRYAPRVRVRTISSIEIKTNPYSGDDPVQYGLQDAGRVNERQVITNYDTAEDVAKLKAHNKNKEIDLHREVIAARHFSGLRLYEALIQESCNNAYESWRAFRQLARMIEDLLPENSSADNDLEGELRSALERHDKYVGDFFVKHPLDEVIKAADQRDFEALKLALGKLKALLVEEPK